MSVSRSEYLVISFDCNFNRYVLILVIKFTRKSIEKYFIFWFTRLENLHAFCVKIFNKFQRISAGWVIILCWKNFMLQHERYLRDNLNDAKLKWLSTYR